MDKSRGERTPAAVRALVFGVIALILGITFSQISRGETAADGWKSVGSSSAGEVTASHEADQFPSLISPTARSNDGEETAPAKLNWQLRRSTDTGRSRSANAASDLRAVQLLEDVDHDGLPTLDPPSILRSARAEDVATAETMGSDTVWSSNQPYNEHDPYGLSDSLPGHDSYSGCDAYGGCDSCGVADCGGFCPPWRCGPPAHVWFRTEYLMWWAHGANVVPLVTTSPPGTPRFVDPDAVPRVPFAGALGQPGTRILFGGEEFHDEIRSGVRMTFGTALDWCYGIGIEGEYFGLNDSQERFQLSSFNGDPIVARPFFNVTEIPDDGATPENESLAAGQSRQIVSFPDLLEGTVTVAAQSILQSGGLRMRQNLCCSNLNLSPCCGDLCCLGDVGPGKLRWDLLLGYRFMRLDDSLGVREDLWEISPEIPVADRLSFVVRDGFNSRTEFHGVDLGLAYEFHRCRWSFDLVTKIAFGNNRQRVKIHGDTQTFGVGEHGVQPPLVDRPGGLLTQTTNIGDYVNDHFSVVPEVGMTLGYKVNRNLKLTAGYTFIYWTNVVRAAEHIDFGVDARLLADPNAAGATRPAIAIHSSDYWAQGINFGGELRW